MDLLECPEIKNTYDKCKYVVKLWEHDFKKKHGRLPSKLDIREADRRVKDAYKKYYQLKTAALEQSFKDVDGFNSDEEVSDTQKSSQISVTPADDYDTNASFELGSQKLPEDTWGSHLNKEVKKKKDENLNTTITKKLFCGSKLSKRYSRKSLSFSQKKSETNLDNSQIISANSFTEKSSSDNITEKKDDILSFEGIFSNNVKISSAAPRICTQPTNIIQSVLDNEYKLSKTVDSGWLERVGESTGVDIKKSEDTVFVDNFEETTNMSLNYNSDDIIDNSDEETSFNLGHKAKKPKIDFSQNLETTFSETCNISSQVSKTHEPEIKNMQDENKTDSQKIDPYEFREDLLASSGSELDFSKSPSTKSKEKRKVKTTSKKLKTNIIRRSFRPNKTVANMTESHSEEEDPFHSDNDSNDPEFTLNQGTNKLKDILREEINIAKTIKKPKEKTKRQTKNRQPEIKEDDENTTYELEFSVKPRATAPRFKNLKKLIKIETSVAKEERKENNEPQVPTKRNLQKEKLEKKIESGSLNENFITINLKKKVYSRGKKNMNFSRYKKQQWKNKKKALAGPEMDMGGCDGGVLTCFNCGDVGHFARNCQKSKGDSLLPLEAAEEDCPFPTLEEASHMAKESAFAVRKPNVEVTESKNCANEEENDNKSDESGDDLFDDDETDVLLTEVLKLEEHAAKLDLQFYLDYVQVVEPYYRLNDDGNVIDTPKEVFAALNKFGYTTFRPGQELAIMRILSGKSTLVTLSTGSGKSLCYQIPAYLYSKREPCISLIISPLVSLMEDQVTGIPSFLKAACLHTNQTKAQREKITEALSSGNLSVLLVSPEAVVAGERSTGFGSLLRKLPPIAFACIDEAHCVSQWSHNFRPSYLMICRVLREKMGVKTILGLTATATRATSDSIIHHLQIPDGRNGIISDIPLPKNLTLTVSKDHQRDNALLALITSERFQNCRSIIIYCTRREECNRIAKFLRTSLQYESVSVSNKKRKRINVEAEPYHAGLSASRRRSIQKAFMSGELRIVVATVAFGMGINKADIRAVIHYNMPKNFESYVQEIGRAGRDGLPAHCHLFLDSKGNDENELRRHIYANSIDRHVIRKLLQKIFLPCSCKDKCPKHEVAFSIDETVRALDIPEENISTLLCYLELHDKHYIELLSPAYTVCKVISYGGPLQIRKAAKECPPLAMALALQKNKTENQQNVIEFAVVDIAAAIGWDSGICKHKLKNLEWTTGTLDNQKFSLVIVLILVNGQPKRSTLNVSFSNLGFRLLAPGNLNDDELDEALDSLYDHVVNQEKTALLQLRAVHQTLIEVADPSYKTCLTVDSNEGNDQLKAKIREYFNSTNPLDSISLVEDEKIVDEEILINNIRGLISTYRDNSFTGRAVARIFHGITSPNYPAVIWGRCKYWRSHINVDFHKICRIATREILNFR